MMSKSVECESDCVIDRLSKGKRGVGREEWMVST